MQIGSGFKIIWKKIQFTASILKIWVSSSIGYKNLFSLYSMSFWWTTRFRNHKYSLSLSQKCKDSFQLSITHVIFVDHAILLWSIAVGKIVWSEPKPNLSYQIMNGIQVNIRLNNRTFQVLLYLGKSRQMSMILFLVKKLYFYHFGQF